MTGMSERSTPSSHNPRPDSVPDLGAQILRMVIAYAKQETLDPLRSLGRFLLWGVAGAVLLSAGVVLVSLAAVRAVQTEAGTHLGGELTWVPYLAGLVVALVAAGLAASRVGKVRR